MYRQRGGLFNAGVSFDKHRIGGLGSHSLFFDRLEAFGLKSVIDYRNPSRQMVTWRGNGRKQSDYVFVSEELHSRETHVQWREDVSDHALVTVEVDLPESAGTWRDRRALLRANTTQL